MLRTEARYMWVKAVKSGIDNELSTKVRQAIQGESQEVAMSSPDLPFYQILLDRYETEALRTDC